MDPREPRLYHYTRYKWLIHILAERAFTPRFCAEDFTWMTGSARYLMVPMVCFCDIPIKLSREHRTAYGNAAIGLSKKWGHGNGLTPLLYISEDAPLTESLRQYNRGITKNVLNPNDFDGVWPLLPYMKPVTGAFPDSTRVTGIKDFDQEMEWRFVPQKHVDKLYTVEIYDAAAKADAQARNRTVLDPKLDFTFKDIDLIVVSTSLQRQTLRRAYPQLRKKIRIWKEIQLI